MTRIRLSQDLGVRDKVWQMGNRKACRGKFYHAICIVGVGDLARLDRSSAIFVNKLHANYQPLAYACLEERIFKKVRDDVNGQTEFDLSFYRNKKIMDWSKNHL